MADESGTIHSFRAPRCSSTTTPGHSAPLDDIGLSDNATGSFVSTRGADGDSGVFAAGLQGAAASDGTERRVNAGLSAVRYTYRLGVDYEPNLFVSEPGQVLSTEESNYPRYRTTPGWSPSNTRALSPASLHPRPECGRCPVDSAVTFATLVQRCGADRACSGFVDAWMDAKVVAVHRRGGST